MIFTCGVRFMRRKSSGPSGCASGSLSAAARRCSAVMASKRAQSCSGVLLLVFVVLSLLTGFGSSGRDDSNRVSSHGVGDEQQPTIHHADSDKSRLIVILAII